MVLSFLKQMFVLIIVKHVTKFASFRMEYHDTSRGVYAKATVRLYVRTSMCSLSAT